ncbi:hypothetical protein KDL01_04730 [Actinospica durhamensis]|uniref:N,N-dimethylformamidase beta subunit-like C-terminal domain-containing protein n=1 Tax=Actinospica durhamensis TaxID=1508375 RepID=A0A941EH80_9ACTN|nr:N,N-dimethylformamidase beta subunit family domain-containing protein [Actinospica durhamensis]MBR7832550.1 hypothetical protein [Actinospica durhamensis]
MVDEADWGRYGAYARSMTCRPGEELEFQLVPGPDGLPDGRTVEIFHLNAGQSLLTLEAPADVLRLAVPEDWPTGFYRADFSPGGGCVWFAIRPAASAPRAKILFSIAFTTFEAYNQRGVPGQGLYFSEQPDRAHRISFDRPGARPSTREWDETLMRWLHRTGWEVDFCSNIDIHYHPEILEGYRMLVCAGHDEYWTWEMRDAIEGFVDRGGNLGIFGGNTCWWQVRLEDEGRTMVCYRDPVLDPMAAIDPRRATTHWSAELINRPENTLTGLSFRRGGGCWMDFDDFAEETYEAVFADHWVFAGTGLSDGERFAKGAIGYEVDGVDLVVEDGVARATGRDGTPGSFVILAKAELEHWRKFGQQGRAVMGVFERGAGSVFNAGTIAWGDALDKGDPVLARVTGNVLERFTAEPDVTRWSVLGRAPHLRCMVVSGTRLYGVDESGRLLGRELSRQNLRWTDLGPAPQDAVAIAAPQEALDGQWQGLYVLTEGGAIHFRFATADPADWTELVGAPSGLRNLAACYAGLFAEGGDTLYYLAFADFGDGKDPEWKPLGPAPALVSLTAMTGRLFAIDEEGRVLSRLPSVGAAGWTDHGVGGGSTVLAAGSGQLLGVTEDGTLVSRSAFGPGIAVAVRPDAGEV